ncbi:GNAT family N-acetyltransferase [Paenibacillus bovis]|uniref:GCN5 family acetyltransferase n=1 Tax=Paenibacillus bovis TaxID=1616788 RepID=A0A172ZF32_9BACL|nr:GNAT family N-acetyltransferase [Paenibacillus bovis]ANF96129.1 GCN5 family acetyltransferase [Paenibacillus bovis]
MITILPVQASDKDLHQLIKELDAYLMECYPAESIYGLDLDDPASFMIAYDKEGLPVGCGAIRALDKHHTELKRFYVRSSHRRQGIASRLLQALEEQAREAGFQIIRLETGAAQPEAIAFYQRYGYEQIERFGIYVDDESSLCYEKKLLHPM